MRTLSSALVRLKHFAYRGLSWLVFVAVRPLVRRSSGQAPAARDRHNTSYVCAVHAMGDEHWDGKVLRFGLVSHPAVLDLGCGPGQWLDSLSRRNGLVVGMDLDAMLLGVAREKTKTNPLLVRGKAEQLTFGPGVFSAVLCYSVLMYTDENLVLEEVFRVLEPGGSLFLGLMGAGYYLKHIVEGARQDRIEDVRYGLDPFIGSFARLVGRPTHISWWTESRAREALIRHGFEFVRSFIDKKDPSWPERFLGAPFYFCVEARKKGDKRR